MLDEKKYTNRLKRQSSQWGGTKADLSTVGYGDGVNPPTDLNAVSFLRKIFDSVAVYLETNDEGVEYLMIDLLEGNFSSHGRPAAWTKSQNNAKEAMDWGNVKVRLLRIHDNEVTSKSPYYKQEWDVLFNLHFGNC